MTKEDNIFFAKRKLVDNIYKSANMEGIAVTFADTYAFMQNVNTGTISVDDMLKLKGLKDAWEYVLNTIDVALTMDYIKKIHFEICKGQNVYPLGEYRDKFNNKGLDVYTKIPDEDVFIKADSRYMYRVLENMYSNISKYAMEGTRVYTDISEKDGNVLIQLKNVSKQKLNISADELMQRFVRGEASRNTEGSGLGLSIARSLTELQDGKFNIYLDGDLFKVTIEFEEEK